MKEKRLWVLLCVVCAAWLLCACTGGGQAGAPASASPVPSACAAPVKLEPLQGAGGTVYGAAGPEGFYSIAGFARPDGSLNIQYTDYASLQTVFLCAQPNCAHDSESCTSFLPGGGGVSLMMVNGQLVLVSPSGSTENERPQLPCVCVCEPDGSSRREVVSFAANQQLVGPYITDGTGLYATLETTEKARVATELIYIDLQAGKFSSVLSLDHTKSETVVSAEGEYMILYARNGYDPNDMNGDYSVCYQRVNINTLEREQIFEYAAGEGLPGVFGRNFLFYSRLKNEIEQIDCLTGERRVLAREVLPAGGSMLELSLCFYDQGRLLYAVPSGEETDNSERTFFVTGADPDSKTEFRLTYLDMERPLPVEPIAQIEGEDSYFVIADRVLLPREDHREDGTSFTAYIPVPVYGKIRCEDFWAGSGAIERAE